MAGIMRSGIFGCVLGLVLFGITGCIEPPIDISNRADVRTWNIGRECELKVERPLYRVGKPYRRLVLFGPLQNAEGGPGVLLGQVTAGTRLRFVRAEEATTYDDGLFQVRRDIVIVRIESGPFAGKEAQIDPAPELAHDPDLQMLPPAP